MLTPRARALVSRLSLAAAMTLPFALGACAGGASSAALDGGGRVARAFTPTIAFENEGHVQVDVYLVTDRRQWRLGRVAAGERTTLRVPAESLEPMPGLARLVALPDAPRSMEAERDPRAALTSSQPVSEILAQQWKFWSPQMGSARLLGARQAGGQPRR
jgi:hypothetical protein